jgi:D-glycero-alpha-D-manno-heptose-7-phosphate kinase
MTLEQFQIHSGATLREAIERIDQNHHGLVMVRGHDGAIIGLATDGDIRRKLLSDASLDDLIDGCCSRNFVWANRATPREMLLKQLDRRVRLIPILDESHRLVDFVTRDKMPLSEESQVYARARSPARVSFGGGGSDLTHYFASEGGAVINATISLYSHAMLRIRQDQSIVVHSRDLGTSMEATGLADALSKQGPFGLVQALIRTVNPDFGFELYLHSDFPMKSGLGGSAVVAATVLGCFNQFRQDKWNSHELAELAYQSERIYLGVEGGWQDQYATIFGGVNFLEFRMDQNLIHPLRIRPDTLLELEESLVLCDTGTTHNSGDIHNDQRQQMQESHVQQRVKANVALTYRIRDFLLRGLLRDFGQALNQAWQLKREFSSKISNVHLDAIYQQALIHGAIGGKLLGAGGGGFFLFYATPSRRHELVDYLTSQGLTVRPFRFDQEGLQAWTVRERHN